MVRAASAAASAAAKYESCWRAVLAGVEIGNFSRIQPGFAPPYSHLPAAFVRTGPPVNAMVESATSFAPDSWSVPSAVVPVHSLNHCARETADVDRLCTWYAMVPESSYILSSYCPPMIVNTVLH
jgi:hypothetical protein